MLTALAMQIVAIGRNYADHVKELNNAIPKEPFFFLKPTSSYLPSGGQVLIPRGITAHHEGEATKLCPLVEPVTLTQPHVLTVTSRTWPRHRQDRPRHCAGGRARTHCRLRCVFLPHAVPACADAPHRQLSRST